MCGINGILGNNTESIRKANQAISHRGPDSDGIYTDQYISMGHVLLSIRGQVSESTQPCISRRSPWVLLFNGQIYNTNEIKSRHLTPREHLGSDVDTNLLYALINKYGWDFFHYIHGMYAIALYNRTERQIRLYRDPSGQKNLYYSTKPNRFAFSSEIKGLLATGAVNKEVDVLAVETSVCIGYIPGSRTIFRGIKKLQLSEMLIVDLESGEITSSCIKVPGNHYYGDLKPRAAIQKTIKDHLQSRYPVAINLSGGLDSCLIYHEAHALGYDIQSYSTSFDIANPGYNEDAKLAALMAREYGMRHQEIWIDKRTYLENYEDAYAAVEEPNYNISLPIYLAVAKFEGINGDGRRVILTGDGGDEVFGGYNYYLSNARYDKMKLPFTRALFSIYKNRGKRYNYDYWSIAERWFSLKNLYKPYLKTNNFSFGPVVNEVVDSYHKYEMLYSIKEKDSIYKMMLLDRCIWLGNENFIRSDKLFMTQSVELRAPLAFQPLRTHFDQVMGKDDYLNKDNNKLFLRKVYQDELPSYIMDKKKSGWRAPVEYWYDAEMKGMFLDILGSVKKGRVINWQAVRNSVERSETYPGKHIHVYLSLAILASRFKLEI
jgi:asparagine synthase (glutamine-hydrolysing)